MNISNNSISAARYFVAVLCLFSLGGNRSPSHFCLGFSVSPSKSVTFYENLASLNKGFESKTLFGKVVGASGSHRSHSNLILQSVSNPDEGETEQDIGIAGNKGINAPKQKGNSALAKIIDASFLLTSVVTQSLGIAVSFGLLLNICGYGYTVDLEKGVHIDRMDKIRTEIQFQREMRR